LHKTEKISICVEDLSDVTFARFVLNHWFIWSNKSRLQLPTTQSWPNLPTKRKFKAGYKCQQEHTEYRTRTAEKNYFARSSRFESPLWL